MPGATMKKHIMGHASLVSFSFRLLVHMNDVSPSTSSFPHFITTASQLWKNYAFYYEPGEFRQELFDQSRRESKVS
jgi:hypothetical protein